MVWGAVIAAGVTLAGEHMKNKSKEKEAEAKAKSQNQVAKNEVTKPEEVKKPEEAKTEQAGKDLGQALNGSSKPAESSGEKVIVQTEVDAKNVEKVCEAIKEAKGGQEQKVITVA